MASNVDINLNARINDFESAFNRVYKHFETLAYKGKDAATSMQQSFSKINETGKREIDSLQKAFNSLSINTDFSMNVQKESLVRAKHFFLEQFLEIRNSGQASADEIARAYAAMNSKIAQLNASSPQGKADAAAKSQVIAQEQAAAQELANINKLRAASVNAEVQKILAAEKAAAQKVIAEQAAANKMLGLHEQALMMNQQFDKQMVISREAALRKMTIAHEEAARMNKLFNEGSLTGTGDIIKKNTEGMNLFGLASIAAIAKIQILYSLINTVMSAIGQAPGIAIDAIENFNSAAITNAALITSMQKGVADIGVAYQNNKKYTVAVQEVLEKMDAETSATAENLTAMNRIFIGHGILIDINNKKQLEGFRNTANAIAALTHGSANQALQFPQEIKGLLEMEDKPGNQLFRALNNLDNGKLKEHLAEWDKIAKKTGDYGLILEKIAPLLQGFSAAQGDINALWETTKTTLLTIRNGVLREALQPAFNDLVNTMKEIVAWATANKSAIADWIETAYKLAKAFGGALWSVLSTIGKIGEPVIWAAITAGLTAAGVGVSALSSLMTALGVKVTIATGGINLMVAALATAAMYVAKVTAVNWSTEQDLNKRVMAIRAAGKYEAADFTPNMLKDVLAVNKNATNEDINKWLKSGALNIGTRNGQQVLDINKNAIMAKANKASPMPTNLSGMGLGKHKQEKIEKPASVSDYNSYIEAIQASDIQAEVDPYVRAWMELDKKYAELQHRFDSLSDRDKVALNKKGLGQSRIDEDRLNAEARLSAEELQKINDSNHKEETAWRKAELDDIKERSIYEQTKIKERLALTETEAKNNIANIQSLLTFGDISKAEAGAALLEQYQTIQTAQEEAAAGMDRGTTAWLTQQHAIDRTRDAILKLKKEQFDSTVQGAMISGLKEYAASAMDVASQIKSATSGAFKSMEDAIVNFAKTGKMSFTDMANSIISDLIRIAVRASITGPLASALGNGITSIFSGLFSAAGGYDIPAGTNPVTQLHEKEMVLPAKYADSIRNMTEGGSSTPNVIVNIENKSNGEVKQGSTNIQFDGKQFVINTIIENVHSNGVLRGMMSAQGA